MNRIFIGTLLTIALVGSAAIGGVASAKSHQLPPDNSQPRAIADYSAQCRTLGDQWPGASMANISNPHLGEAKAEAARGERFCKSTDIAMDKKGVEQYEAALQLIGVTPAI